MRLLIAWLIASALGLLLWQPFGRAAKRGDVVSAPLQDSPAPPEEEET